MLAASGLLNGRAATSHWAYKELFRTRFAKVDFRPEAILCAADPSGRIVTAGGTTSWHDLAIHTISRHCSLGEALRVAKIYLLKWHGEGQLPYASLVSRQPRADSVVRHAEHCLGQHFREPHAVAAVVAAAGIPERILKRRFKAATATTLIEHGQNLRIEEAKRLVEGDEIPSEAIAAKVGCENAAFFRRLFKRCTGLTPGRYRRIFRPISLSAEGGARRGDTEPARDVSRGDAASDLDPDRGSMLTLATAGARPLPGPPGRAEDWRDGARGTKRT